MGNTETEHVEQRDLLREGRCWYPNVSKIYTEKTFSTSPEVPNALFQQPRTIYNVRYFDVPRISISDVIKDILCQQRARDRCVRPNAISELRKFAPVWPFRYQIKSLQVRSIGF
jgi:hypothetical protein